MARRFAQLLRIDQNRQIRNDADYEFLHQLQHGLLLALRERGTLNATQYRQAEEKLKRHRRDRAEKLARKDREGK